MAGQKMKELLKTLGIFFLLLMISPTFLGATTPSLYVNDMDYVLGDAKQAFIKDKISTEAQADNLIKGFKNLKVNGIRIPIFADGLCPNKTMFDYFYNKAVAEGFKIFANPALHGGGQRIANGVLFADDLGGPVKSNATKKQNLIARIKAFAAEYPCTWISPFNEDGKTGNIWTANQITTIYSALVGNVNGAELVGPDAWGIPASIDVFENTTIRDNITVATTHNLGFNHNSWAEFIALAKEKGLPVWDSEVNHNDKFGTGTRLEAAINAGVDGLVLYNSWQFFALNSGSLNNTGRTFMSYYIDPDYTGISDLWDNGTLEFRMYPNPATRAVTLSLDEAVGEYTIAIYNLSGAVVYQARGVFGSAKVNIESFSSGVYMVKVESKEGVGSSKLVVE